jgi:phage baseplate assembly protein W
VRKFESSLRREWAWGSFQKGRCSGSGPSPGVGGVLVFEAELRMNHFPNGKDILGVGWHFPVRVDRKLEGETVAPDRGKGGIALARYEEDIDQAIRIILSTSKGERRMRPTFGCDIHNLLFAPANATTFGLLRYYVEEALTMWEPRITLREVLVSPSDDGRVDIFINYEVRSTKDERTLVYPFYRMGEG